MKGREIDASRKTIAEAVLRQIEECRGLRRFLLRGLAKVNGEWALWSLTHSINKLFRYRRTQAVLATG